MFRFTMTALVALFAASVSASAQTAFPYWLGSAVIDSVSSQCAGAFIAKNDVLESAYRAKTGISGEPNNPGINFYQARSTMSYFRTAGNATTMNGAGSGSAYLIRGNVTTIPNPSQNTFPFTFNFKVTPATITKTTQTVTVDGWINNWRGVTNCKVTFRAAYRLGNWQ
ncbi:MAG TPA: hypothetical protein VG986_14095 [Pseudolabrys sp.]|nr:hypothetical protein [Pseudolabrys sp.]